MNGAVDRHLGILLGCIAIAGAAIVVPNGRQGPTRPVSVDTLPRTAAQWVSVDGAPDAVVPRDERALQALRRTYSDGTSTVWLAISRYGSMSDPRKRPVLDAVIPPLDPTRSTKDHARIALDSPRDGPVVLNRVVIRKPEGELSLMFWYQLGGDVIASDYQLRLRVLLDSLVGYQRDILLVRLATNGPPPPEGLFRALYPQIVALQQ
jgi:EpsI family protein